MVCPNDSTIGYNSGDAGTVPMVQNLYQGMLQDAVTGLYYERNRNYSPSLGMWISQDPLQYINGANTYHFVMGNPVVRVDAWGAAAAQITVDTKLYYFQPQHPAGRWVLAGEFKLDVKFVCTCHRSSTGGVKWDPAVTTDMGSTILDYNGFNEEAGSGSAAATVASANGSLDVRSNPTIAYVAGSGAVGPGVLVGLIGGMVAYYGGGPLVGVPAGWFAHWGINSLLNAAGPRFAVTLRDEWRVTCSGATVVVANEGKPPAVVANNAHVKEN